MDYNSVYNEGLQYFNQLMAYNYLHYINSQVPYAAMANFTAPLYLTPPQYMPQMLNVPQLSPTHQVVRLFDSTKQGTHTITATTGTNRRRIFKQKCQRYVPPPHTDTSTGVQASRLPLPEVVSPVDTKGVFKKFSQAAIIPEVTANSYRHIPTVPKNVFIPPRTCSSPVIQGKENKSAMVTSTPNTVGRRHIFKKKCNRYVPKALEEVPAGVIEGLNNVTDEQYEVGRKLLGGLATETRELIGIVPEKQNTLELENPNSVGKSRRNMEETWTHKIEEFIKEVSDKISLGATTQTIAHLNDEFEKLVYTLRHKGYDIEDKNASNQKATSPNTAIPDLPEPAKIKYPLEPEKVKKEKPMKKSHYNYLKPLKAPRQKSSADKKVPIGMGYAQVPARLLKSMNWKSYSNCTRKLMTAVFPRRILATHSLTGKASPAFPGKPAKKMLNPMLINDIITTVMDKCDVSESQVRVCVTTKCADESKMLRSHEQKKVNPRGNHKENYPPSSATDDDSVYGASD